MPNHHNPEARSARLVELYADAHIELHRYLMARLPSRQDAEDVEQECYLRIHHCGKILAVKNPRAFLFRIASNILADRARWHTRQRKHQQLLGKPVHVDDTEDAPSAQPTPESAAAKEQELAIILEAAASLPSNCRRALIMQRFDGLSHAQIAQALQVSRSMVEKYIAQALYHLHRALL